MDVSSSTPPNPPHSTVKPAETRVGLKTAPSSSKRGEKNDTAGRGEMHSKKLALSSSPDSPEPQTLPLSPSASVGSHKPTDAGQDEVQPKKPPISSSLYAPDSTSPAPGRRHSAHTTRKPSPLEMDVETRETSFSADNPLTKERGREGKVHLKGHALAVTAAFRAERLGRNRAGTWMQSTANMMGLSAAPSKSEKKKSTTESDSYPNPNLARPWRWLFATLNIVVALLSWMPAFDPNERSFWFWIGLRFTFIPFSFLFTAVLFISCPYEGLQPSQITAALATLAAVLPVFVQPYRRLDAENHFTPLNLKSPEGYIYLLAYILGGLVCVFRVRQVKNNQVSKEIVYHVVLKKLLPLSMSLVLMMLYFISPVGKCLGQKYIYWTLKNPGLENEWDPKLFFVCEDLIISSSALLTVCVIFFIFAIYITPFNDKDQNTTEEQSNNNEDGDVDDGGDDIDIDIDIDIGDDISVMMEVVDENNLIDRLIMFKFPFIQQVTIIGVFVVTSLSLFVYATQTEFYSLDEWEREYKNRTTVTGRFSRTLISFTLMGISFGLLLANASAEHPIIQRLARNRLLTKLENSMSGVKSTELAPFYRHFCVINVFLLNFATAGYVYWTMETGRGTHVIHIWYIIMQATMPLIGLLCSIHFLSRPKVDVTILDRLFFSVPAIQSLCIIIATIASEEPYEFKPRSCTDFDSTDTRIGLLGPTLILIFFPVWLHYAEKGRQIFRKKGQEDEAADEESKKRVFQNHLAYILQMSIQLAPSILFLWSEIIGQLENVDHLKKHQSCEGCEVSLDEVINLVDCDLLSSSDLR
ncbi:hypothetical protein TrST_g3713 [Triparma strigata]|uniref:Uncharacterized protein n=1 Tax=Triparma strigata TaxID=1606541 RepID=A0A9W6ZMG6_9STRA|nr:hypothetical protein TrST_g3713 [Triparma strigata]